MSNDDYFHNAHSVMFGVIKAVQGKNKGHIGLLLIWQLLKKLVN